MTFSKNIVKQVLLDRDPYNNINTSAIEKEKIIWDIVKSILKKEVVKYHLIQFTISLVMKKI